MQRKGFTLIELLIVVAIIAILAAIAVPNFLEAQVRSKVARVKSDQRTLATAAEAYTVDNNNPFIGINQCTWYGNGRQPWMPNGNAIDWCWSFWTTPVAYVTSIPTDPFALTGKFNSKAGGPVTLGADKRYIYVAAYDHQLDGSQPAAMVSPATGSTTGLRNIGISWVMYSYGPSKLQRPKGLGSDAILGLSPAFPSTAGQARYPDMFYDPSNGTTSYGYIYRSNRGIEPSGR